MCMCVGEMAQWLKHFLCKHEDLSLIPRTFGDAAWAWQPQKLKQGGGPYWQTQGLIERPCLSE